MLRPAHLLDLLGALEDLLPPRPRAEVLLLLAEALTDAGHRGGAASALAAARSATEQEGPGKRDLVMGLARGLARLARAAEVEALLKPYTTAPGGRPDPELLATLAYTGAALGDAAGARSALTRQAPGAERLHALLPLGRLPTAAGDPSEAASLCGDALRDVAVLTEPSQMAAALVELDRCYAAEDVALDRAGVALLHGLLLRVLPGWVPARRD